MTARLDASDVDRMARRGFLPLPASRAVAALDAALDHAGRCGTAHVLALSLDRSALASRALFDKLRPSAERADGRPAGHLGGHRSPGCAAQLSPAFVAASARKVLGLPGECRDPAAPAVPGARPRLADGRRAAQRGGCRRSVVPSRRRCCSTTRRPSRSPTTSSPCVPTPDAAASPPPADAAAPTVADAADARRAQRGGGRGAAARRARPLGGGAVTQPDAQAPTPGAEELSPLKRAIVEIRDLRARLAEARARPFTSRSRSSASGCASPAAPTTRRRSGTCSPDGVDAIREVPAERWPADALLRPRPGHARADGHPLGRLPRRRRPVRRRVLRDLAARGREHRPAAAAAARGDVGGARARRHPRRPACSGRSAGVFVGIANSDYMRLLLADRDADRHLHHDRQRARASPPAGSPTCSARRDRRWRSTPRARRRSSPCTSPRRRCAAGECDLALAGGVNLILTPGADDQLLPGADDGARRAVQDVRRRRRRLRALRGLRRWSC